MSRDIRRRMVIAGGAGALGSVLVRRAVDTGWTVATIDRRCGLNAAAGQRLTIGGTDLENASATSTAFDHVAAQFGGLEAVINVTGGFAWATISDAGDEVLASMLNTNLMTSWNIARAAVGNLERGGRLVHLGAAAVGLGGVGMGPYAAAKAGVMELTRSLASELAPLGVTVNAVLPGIIDTPANRIAMPEADRSSWTSAEAVADVILFLASPASRGINGALIPVSNPG